MPRRPLEYQKLFFVYVLGSGRKDDRRTYVGWTTDPEKDASGSTTRERVPSQLEDGNGFCSIPNAAKPAVKP
jgi:hypothetical protein